MLSVIKLDKKLSCRKETAWRFVSLNISLSHSRSLKTNLCLVVNRVRELSSHAVCSGLQENCGNGRGLKYTKFKYEKVN